jgi:heptosyltransferase-1
MAPLVDLSRFRSALILKPSSLGDIVHTLPAVHAINAAHPHLNVRWVANTEWMPLLEGNSDISEIIQFPRKEFRGLSGLPAILKWARKLNTAAREVPEIALDFQGLLRSALVALTRGAEPIIGMSDAREGASKFYRHTVPVDRTAHSVERYLSIPRALGVDVTAADLTFPIPEGKKPDNLDVPKNFLLLHPYARGRGKSLSDDFVQALCDVLTSCNVVIVGRSAGTRRPTGSHLHDAVNKTSLPELIWLIRNARGVISVDSGPMHIAAAVTDNTLGLHTWSNPRTVGPYNQNAWVWKAGRIAHRSDFTDDEVRSEQILTNIDARRTADFVLREWF